MKQDYTCQMCGAVFLIKERFEKHKEIEIPDFISMNNSKRETSEKAFADYRISIGLPLIRWKHDKHL